jgi:hypothetical protein
MSDIYIEPYPHWDDEEDDCPDVCDHGIGFDCNCPGCESDPIGCLFPGKCCMVGEHVESECHTAEMMEQMYEAGEA